MSVAHSWQKNTNFFKITGGNSRLLVSGMKAGFLQDFMYI